MLFTQPHCLLTDYDIRLFKDGRHYSLYEKMGAHILSLNGVEGVQFSVFAPRAAKVEIVGDFNGWDGRAYQLFFRFDESGIWEGFIPGVKAGHLYKYRIYSELDHIIRDKADPFARATELMPQSASVVWHRQFSWQDRDWLRSRTKWKVLEKPVAIYEMHLGSWKKQGDHSLSYRQLAQELTAYLLEMEFTHVEFLPLTEHPYYPSWGYLPTSYFAPTSRYGSPDDLRFLIDTLHQKGIGVLMDWVPAHFPGDGFALADFDGSCVYEHPDPRKGFHPDWNSLIFNYERNEIRSFLISSAYYWIKEFHLDGLRVDAVTSMMFLNYSRQHGQWEPNEMGGTEYLAAMEFLRELNTSIYKDFPGVMMIAEESSSYPGISKPVYTGGLGFGFKWMMGWMNDVLTHFARDPIYRKYHRNEISFSFSYAWNEQYILPLSHDEVVHGKASLIYKMPGDEWQKFAHLRLLFAFMYTHPGHKLLFMGNEIAQTKEWDFNNQVSWELLAHESHKGMKNLVKTLNHILQKEKPLYELSYTPEGCEWIDYSDPEYDVLCFLRKSKTDTLLIVANFVPVTIYHYKIGVPAYVEWQEIFNTDHSDFWGSAILNKGVLKARKSHRHQRHYEIEITIPALALCIFKPRGTKIADSATADSK